MDYETLVNCFVGVFQHYKDDSISEIFIITKDQNDLPKFINFLKSFSLELNKEEIEKIILDNAEVISKLEGKSPKRVIVIPGKIINIVC